MCELVWGKKIRGLGRLEMIVQAGNPGRIPSSDLLGLVCVHCIQTYTLGHTDILIKINRVKVVVQCSKTLARRTRV